jgi:putative membrane protein
VESAVSLTLFSLLAAMCFSAIGYALRLPLGAAGMALFGLFLLVQVAALANVLPLETAPGVLQALNGLMPLTAYVDGANRLVSGGEVGSVAGAVVVMALWGLVALISTTVVVRRQRMVPATPTPATS